MKKYTLTEKQLEYIVNTTVHNTIKECKKLQESFLDEHDGEILEESDYDHEEMWENICDIIELDFYNEDDDYERDFYISKPELRDYFDDQVKYEYEHNHVNIHPDSFEEFLDYCVDKKMWNVTEYMENDFYDNAGNWDPIDEDVDIEDMTIEQLQDKVIELVSKCPDGYYNFEEADNMPVTLDTIDPNTDDNIEITALQYQDDDVIIYAAGDEELSLREVITDDADLESLIDLLIDGAEFDED